MSCSTPLAVETAVISDYYDIFGHGLDYICRKTSMHMLDTKSLAKRRYLPADASICNSRAPSYHPVSVFSDSTRAKGKGGVHFDFTGQGARWLTTDSHTYTQRLSLDFRVYFRDRVPRDRASTGFPELGCSGRKKAGRALTYKAKVKQAGS